MLVNRYMIRDMYELELDPCDECIITAAICCQCLVCILACVLGIDNDLCEMLADLIWFTVLGCGLAQNSLELDYQTGKLATPRDRSLGK